ncbi:MAG TPA: hypothetical protein VGS79_24805 [Puia sp.]|nr:hypothetical protein [Puia sp.]
MAGVVHILPHLPGHRIINLPFQIHQLHRNLFAFPVRPDCLCRLEARRSLADPPADERQIQTVGDGLQQRRFSVPLCLRRS